MVETTMMAWKGTQRAHSKGSASAGRVVPTTNDLAVLVLPWTKTNHPKKYADTIAKAGEDHGFRRYLLRLIEIRWEENREWRRSVPLAVLAETAITTRVRMENGREVEVCGRLAKGDSPLLWSDLALCSDAEGLAQMLDAIEGLDLERVDT